MLESKLFTVSSQKVNHKLTRRAFISRSISFCLYTQTPAHMQSWDLNSSDEACSLQVHDFLKCSVYVGLRRARRPGHSHGRVSFDCGRIRWGLARGCPGCRWARAGDGSCSSSLPGPPRGSWEGRSGHMWCFPRWPARTESKTLPPWTSSWTVGRGEERGRERKWAEENFHLKTRKKTFLHGYCLGHQIFGFTWVFAWLVFSYRDCFVSLPLKHIHFVLLYTLSMFKCNSSFLCIIMTNLGCIT